MSTNGPTRFSRRNRQRKRGGPSNGSTETKSTIVASRQSMDTLVAGANVISALPNSPDSGSTSRNREPSKSKPNPKRGELPCHAWKSGHCPKGAKCWFAHDPEVQAAEFRRQEVFAARAEAEARGRIRAAEANTARIARRDAEQARLEAVQAALIEAMRVARTEADVREAERERLEEIRRAELEAARQADLQESRRVAEVARQAKRAEQLAAQEVRIAEIAKEEAVKTVQHIVLGSSITFGAGLEIRHVLTGFQSCVIRMKNIPQDARLSEVSTLFTQQGLEPESFHIISMKRTSGGKQEAEIIAELEGGRALAIGLDGISFRDEILAFDVKDNAGHDSMGEATGRDSDVLTISWRAPSISFVVQYSHVQDAEAKVRQLDKRVVANRRIKVEMDRPPPGPRTWAHLVRPLSNSVKISNLSPETTYVDVTSLAGSFTARQLTGGNYNLTQAILFLRQCVENGGTRPRAFDVTQPGVDGVVRVNARFASWEQAKQVYDRLDKRRFPQLGNATLWLRLPDPLLYVITISVAQYRAQKELWTSLRDGIKDLEACKLAIVELDRVVKLSVVGSDKQAVGHIKVRVESLAAGEKLDCWHRSLAQGFSPFLRGVADDTGVYILPDRRQQRFKIFGKPAAVQDARTQIEAEISRLVTSMEYGIRLKQQSVGFFIRRGVPALKETFGEESVTFNPLSRKIAVTGGEVVMHALHRLIEESDAGLDARAPAGDNPCPVCFDDVSVPVQLGCGHIYCTACLRHFITSASETEIIPLKCAGDEARCGTPIPIPTIEKYLTPPAFSRLLEVAFSSHVGKNPQQFKYCKTPDCTQIYRCSNAGTPTLLQCPSCLNVVCSSCDEGAHEGMTCAERRIHADPAEQERLTEEWMMQQGGTVKRCPECRVLIEKTEGCNHMSCQCGAHICWRCMGIFTPATIYAHMNAVHGGIHENEDVVPAPNEFRQQEELLRQAEARQRLYGNMEQLRFHDAANRVRIEHVQNVYRWDAAEQRERALAQAREEERRELAALVEAQRRRQLHDLNRLAEQEDARMRATRERERVVREREREREQMATAAADREGGWGCTIM